MRYAPLLQLAVALAGCAPPPPGAATTFDDFCDAKYDSPTPDGSGDALLRVSIEGYLEPPAMFSMCTETCSFDLFEEPNRGGRSIHYSVRLGTGKNRLAPLPKTFAPADFKLRTQDDATLGFGDRARLHGKRLGTAAKADCQLYHVDLIEKP